MSEDKPEGEEEEKAGKKEADSSADVKEGEGMLENEKTQSKDSSAKKNFKFLASDFEFGAKKAGASKDLEEKKTKDTSKSGSSKRVLKDEEIRHNWPTIDRQPKVSHVEPRFKTAADRTDDI